MITIHSWSAVSVEPSGHKYWNTLCPNRQIEIDILQYRNQNQSQEESDARPQTNTEGTLAWHDYDMRIRISEWTVKCHIELCWVSVDCELTLY